MNTTQPFGHFHFTDFRETWQEYVNHVLVNPFAAKF